MPAANLPSPLPGAVSAFRLAPPGPPLPTPQQAYEVAVDHGAQQLRVARVRGGLSAEEMSTDFLDASFRAAGTGGAHSEHCCARRLQPR